MLISIAVTTYNSSEFIIELLESIKVQTYRNIEVVIADDASKDATVDIVTNWIQRNRDRFIGLKLLTTPVNLGVTKNVNRAIRACNGNWVKIIAGDDVFEPDAIELYSKIASGSDSAVIFSSMSCFSKQRGTFEVRPVEEDKRNILTNPDNLLSLLISEGNILPAPAAVHNRKILEKLNYFDESILFEDYPYWIKCLSYGYSFNFELINNPLIRYRIHDASICNTKNTDVYTAKIKSHILTIKKYILPHIKRDLYWTIEYNLRIIEYSSMLKTKNIHQIVMFLIKIVRKFSQVLKKLRSKNSTIVILNPHEI